MTNEITASVALKGKRARTMHLQVEELSHVHEIIDDFINRLSIVKVDIFHKKDDKYYWIDLQLGELSDSEYENLVNPGKVE